MQFGFGKKKKKGKSKAQKRNKTGKQDEQDVKMSDSAAPAVEERATPVEGTAKEKHKAQLELKKSLKAKMGLLKKQRSKATKIPGKAAKGQRVGPQLESLMQENLQSMMVE